jgi:thiol-disulfide isomerase/thioredoxin
MQRFLLTALTCGCAFVVAHAAPAPLNVKEIALMLRTGYTSPTVIGELSKRNFAGTLGETEETQLIQAGASAELLAALRAGTYTLSAAEVARVQDQKAAEAERRAAAADEARKSSTLYQAKMAQARATDAVRQNLDQHVVYQQLKGDLVQWHNGALSHYDDAALENKKLFLIYFSAHWCQPCRLFTPGLVNYYNEMVTKYPDFELIFVSRDKSPFGMETYMHESNMPWPAIDYQKVASKEGILKYAGDGIPDLVLVDSSGRVLADSFQNKQYVGPAKVVEALNGFLTGRLQAPAVAQAH